MELKFFNKTNSSLLKTGEPIVRVNTTAGLISFSKTAGELLGLSEHSKVSFAQNPQSKNDWYIFIDPVDGFKCRTTKDSKGFDFNSTPLAKEIISAALPKAKAAGFKISKTQVEVDGSLYWLLITANPLNPKM